MTLIKNKLKLDQNRNRNRRLEAVVGIGFNPQLNSDSLESKSSMNQFQTPYCLSLLYTATKFTPKQKLMYWGILAHREELSLQ